MTDLPVSVVIVSRGRPQSLARTLTGISQLQYWNFEVVVVADPEGIASAAALPFSDDLKLVPFDTPNISAARNLGLRHAAGEIIAFIDDDAVPEPMWLRHLVAPASQSDVAAMGGSCWMSHLVKPWRQACPCPIHPGCMMANFGCLIQVEASCAPSTLPPATSHQLPFVPAMHVDWHLLAATQLSACPAHAKIRLLRGWSYKTC